MRRFYVTTPIYYVNDLPHIGHIYTTVVADTLARYRRLAGEEVYFLTGTDEHGQNIQRAAAEKDLSPKELADQVVSRYHELWRDLAISHDDFIRTTEPRHRRGVEELISRIEAGGDLYLDRHEGWYCAACEAFYTEKELAADKLCPDHGRPAEWRSEENLFFRLSRYQQALLDWYDENPAFVRPESRANEVRSFVAGGLRDLSVSRAHLDWGIPFPGRPGQTVYVWLDALTNYISALGFGPAGESEELYRKFWAAEETRRLHLVGKDILRFHAIYWPAFLLAAGLPLPDTVWAHGWWLRDERKVSKSVGNIVRPDDLIARFGTDSLRYFLLREMVFGQDASFSDEAFIDRFNSDLANDLGNTVSRVVTVARNNFGGRVPAGRQGEGPLAGAAARAAAEYREAMEELCFHRALEALWRLLSETNGYLVAEEPWKRIKSEGASSRVAQALWGGLEAVRIVAAGLLPFLPKTAPRILRAVGSPEVPEDLGAMSWGGTAERVELPEPEALFPRIDRDAYLAAATPVTARPAESAERRGEEEEEMITIEEFSKIDLRVATVIAAEAIPKADKLLKLTVELGGGTRTMVAGIAREYRPEDLVGKQVVVVANLKPATLMGVESQGMVLAATDDGRPVLIHPDAAVPDGTKVR